MLPTTSSVAAGTDVLIPSLPLVSMRNAVLVAWVGDEVEIKNAGTVEVPVIERSADGEVVPRPRLPD